MQIRARFWLRTQIGGGLCYGTQELTDLCFRFMLRPASEAYDSKATDDINQDTAIHNRRLDLGGIWVTQRSR
jgi:hypothetical protein